MLMANSLSVRVRVSAGHGLMAGLLCVACLTCGCCKDRRVQQLMPGTRHLHAPLYAESTYHSLLSKQGRPLEYLEFPGVRSYIFWCSSWRKYPTMHPHRNDPSARMHVSIHVFIHRHVVQHIHVCAGVVQVRLRRKRDTWAVCENVYSFCCLCLDTYSIKHHQGAKNKHMCSARARTRQANQMVGIV
jgi:hypothetical protein